MREIKFRAYDWRNLEMRKGNFFVNFNGDVYEVHTPEDFSIVYHFEVMQYTGLNDINGKEIYEGDILAWKNQNDKGVVFYRNGAFKVSNNQFDLHDLDFKNIVFYDDLTSSLIKDNHLMVIGNIYENPELLGDVTKIQ